MILSPKVKKIIVTSFIAILFCILMVDKAISIYEIFNPPNIIFYVK